MRRSLALDTMQCQDCPAEFMQSVSRISRVPRLHDFKPRLESLPQNVPPISILPCLSKILEKIISPQLTNYFEINNIVSGVSGGAYQRKKLLHNLSKSRSWF